LFTLIRPTEEQLRVLIERNKDAPFSYAAVGATRGGPLPAGYKVDRNRVWLGSGQDVFEKAQRGLRTWAMFDLGWVRTFPHHVDIQPGSVVAVVVSHFGFWSVNLSRIVFAEDSSSFAYGTLAEHAESGEEKFSVIWNASDDSVWYDVLAFSKPNHALARAGYPLARLLQKRFARDSMAAMKRLTESPRSPW
jgi:uncharacterized protein (UPF0548 family)